MPHKVVGTVRRGSHINNVIDHRLLHGCLGAKTEYGYDIAFSKKRSIKFLVQDLKKKYVFRTIYF